MKQWHKKSWRNFEYKQKPRFDNHKDLKSILNNLKKSDPIICPEEVNELKIKLSEIVEEKGFLLHCGECVESFSDHRFL